jgi:phage terminase small subunit
MSLTDKQEQFAQEYIIDLNATQAAIRAGYSEKTAGEQGSRLLKNVKVLTRIDELKQERAERNQLDQDWVLTRLRQISDRCVQAEPVLKWDYEERMLVETGEYQFDSVGANKATELIGKHLGMFKDKVEHSGNMVIFKGEDDLED